MFLSGPAYFAQNAASLPKRHLRAWWIFVANLSMTGMGEFIWIILFCAAVMSHFKVSCYNRSSTDNTRHYMRITIGISSCNRLAHISSLTQYLCCLKAGEIRKLRWNELFMCKSSLPKVSVVLPHCGFPLS